MSPLETPRTPTEDAPMTHDATPDPDLTAACSEELLGRWCDRGEHSAFRRLADRYQPRLERLVTRRLPLDLARRVDAQDVVQEILARTVKAAGGFDDRGRGSLWAWVRGISAHVLNDVWRRQDRNRVGDVDVDDSLNHPEADEQSPLARLVQDERGQLLLGAIAKLRDRERRAILLRLESGMSFQAIARALGYASPDAARMSVGRALRQVAERIGAAGAADMLDA